MEIRFEESELEGGTYLGAGTHEVRITKIEKKGNKKGTGENLEIEFTSAAEQTTRDWFPVTGNKFKLAKLALACGFDKGYLIRGGFDTAMLAHKNVRLVREVTGEEAFVDSSGKAGTRKNYQNSYLPSQAKPPSAASADSEIPF